jgi:hypothetical protein
MRHRTVAVVTVLGLAGGCRGPSTDLAVAPPDSGVVVNVVAHDVSPPLRELAVRARALPRSDEAPEAEPVHRIPHARMRSFAAPDPVVQHAPGAAPIDAPIADFEGLGAGIPNFQVGGVPPDTDGDIGPNHYVEVVNVSLGVFSRTGELVMPAVDTGTIWSGFSGACAQTNDGDATVRYDHLADRWVIAQFSIEGQNYQCVAVSTSPDPTGSYARYQFDFDALNDYPKAALWPDAYYFTFNMFPASGFAGAKVCAMDRAKMLAGAPDATMQCFDSGPNYGGLLAADLDGKTLPPAGAPNPLVALDSNTALAYWQLHVDFATPANSKFQGPSAIPVASYAALCDGGTCIEQPGGGSQLDSLADRAMNRFVYRRFADHESLVLSHAVAAGGGGGVRWYELRTPSTPTVFQQGTFAPDSAYRWIPSIAMDAAGDIAAIYTVSSATINPSIRYTARVPSDPPGTMGLGEGTIVAGAGAQTQISRWGDYGSLNIDPVDDCTFWGANEYKKEAGRSNWRTRIAAFRLASCGSFSLSANDAETVAQGGTATYPIDSTTDAGSPQSLQLSADGLPAGVTATLNPATIMSGGASSITLTATSTATLGATHYTVAAVGTSGSRMIDVALTVVPAATMADAALPSPSDGGPAGAADGSWHGGCCRASRDESPAASAMLMLAVAFMLARRRRARSPRR